MIAAADESDQPHVVCADGRPYAAGTLRCREGPPFRSVAAKLDV
jgi:hypothetical protein